LVIPYSVNDSAGQVSCSESSPPLSPPGPSRKRKRHPAWIEANRLAKSLYTPDVVRREVELANAYWEDTGDKALVFFAMCHNPNCRPYRARGMPYFNRFSPAYRRKIRKELWKYRSLIAKFKHFLFLTLTVDTKRFHSQYEAKRFGERKWNSLRTRIRKRCPWCVIIASREWQQNGIGIHFHALIAGTSYIPKDWIMESWRDLSESGWAVELKTLNLPADAVLNYVLKYVVKSAVNEKTGEIENISAVINWAVNGRAFSVSLPKSARLGFLKSNYNRGLNPCSCRWVFLGYVPYHIYELGLTSSVDWVIEYFGLDKPPPYN